MRECGGKAGRKTILRAGLRGPLCPKAPFILISSTTNDAARLLFQPLNPAFEQFVTHDFTKLLLFFSRFTTQRHILLPFLVLPE